MSKQTGLVLMATCISPKIRYNSDSRFWNWLLDPVIKLYLWRFQVNG